MGKLEDIPKKQIFNVPENYFDKLPAQIQSRISTVNADRGIRPVYRYGLRYALPLLVVLVMSIYFFKNASTPDTESILASVETTELIYYLNDSDLSTEDLLENVDFYPEDLDALENEVYDLNFTDFDLDDTQDEMPLNQR